MRLFTRQVPLSEQRCDAYFTCGTTGSKDNLVEGDILLPVSTVYDESNVTRLTSTCNASTCGRYRKVVTRWSIHATDGSFLSPTSWETTSVSPDLFLPLALNL